MKKIMIILSIMVLLLVSGCSVEETSYPKEGFSDDGFTFSEKVKNGTNIYKLSEQWNISTGIFLKTIESSN